MGQKNEILVHSGHKTVITFYKPGTTAGILVNYPKLLCYVHYLVILCLSDDWSTYWCCHETLSNRNTIRIWYHNWLYSSKHYEFSPNKEILNIFTDKILYGTFCKIMNSFRKLIYSVTYILIFLRASWLDFTYYGSWIAPNKTADVYSR